MTFEYEGSDRLFELKAKTKELADEWFDKLSFIQEILDKIGETDILRAHSGMTAFSKDSNETSGSTDSEERKSSVSESWKF